MTRATMVGVALALLCGCGASGVPLGGTAPEGEGTPQTLLDEARPTGIKIVVVGIDGLTFRVLDPLIAGGRLPTLASMRTSGVSGRMAAREPMWSPALWTTLATGHPRERHGVGSFLAPESGRDDPVLVTSRHRRTLALWNVASFFGLRSTVVGWWVTWPAEEIRGTLVSDRFARSRWSAWTDGDKDSAVTWPADLGEELRPLVVEPSTPPLDELRAILPMSEMQVEELTAAEEPIFGHGLSVLKFAFCAQRTYERIALRLLPGVHQPDLSAVLLIASDPISHTFWHYHEPGAYPDLAGRPPGEGDPVVAIYERDDAFVAELFDSLEPDTVRIVISDHGFRASGELPRQLPKERFEEIRSDGMRRGTVTVGQSGVHETEGVFLAAGGPFVSGATVEVEPLDVAPTILHLLGLPVPDDMPGRVLLDALDPEWVAGHPVRRVPTFEGVIPGPSPPEGVLPEEAQRENLDRLRALGYID